MGCGANGCTFEAPKSERGFKLLRDDAVMPTRATKSSAGYDFSIPKDIEEIEILPSEIKLIPLGVAAYMKETEYLDLRIRSSISRKGLIFMNGCGVIDSDYYPNDIGIIVCNLSGQSIKLSGGTRVAQGIFTEYHTVSNEGPITKDRVGGYGSTGGTINE